MNDFITEFTPKKSYQIRMSTKVNADTLSKVINQDFQPVKVSDKKFSVLYVYYLVDRKIIYIVRTNTGRLLRIQLKCFVNSQFIQKIFQISRALIFHNNPLLYSSSFFATPTNAGLMILSPIL